MALMAPAEISLALQATAKLLLAVYLQGIRHRERRQTNFPVMTGPDKVSTIMIMSNGLLFS
jgi:hypothetical protein